jgi:hypothetical protein
MIAGPAPAAEPAGDDAADGARRGERWTRGRQGRGDRPARPGISEEEAVAAGIPRVFRDSFPDRAKRLAALERSKPALYRRALVSLHRMTADLENIKTHDPELHRRRWTTIRLRVEADELADRRREAARDPERRRLDDALVKKVRELFDAREEEYRLRVRHAEEELAVLKERCDRRKKNRERMVARMLEELRAEEPLDF